MELTRGRKKLREEISMLRAEKSARDKHLEMKEKLIQQLEAEKKTSHKELEKKDKLIQQLQEEKDAVDKVLTEQVKREALKKIRALRGRSRKQWGYGNRIFERREASANRREDCPCQRGCVGEDFRQHRCRSVSPPEARIVF